MGIDFVEKTFDAAVVLVMVGDGPGEFNGEDFKGAAEAIIFDVAFEPRAQGIHGRLGKKNVGSAQKQNEDVVGGLAEEESLVGIPKDGIEACANEAREATPLAGVTSEHASEATNRENDDCERFILIAELASPGLRFGEKGLSSQGPTVRFVFREPLPLVQGLELLPEKADKLHSGEESLMVVGMPLFSLSFDDNKQWLAIGTTKGDAGVAG